MTPKYRRMLKGMKNGKGKDWSVYIARCCDDSLYTGIAKNVEARIKQHNAGKGAAYVRTRLPAALLYQENGLSRSGALIREAAIKAMPRARKEQLVLSNGKSPRRTPSRT